MCARQLICMSICASVGCLHHTTRVHRSPCLGSALNGLLQPLTSLESQAGSGKSGFPHVFPQCEPIAASALVTSGDEFLVLFWDEGFQDIEEQVHKFPVAMILVPGRFYVATYASGTTRVYIPVKLPQVESIMSGKCTQHTEAAALCM